METKTTITIVVIISSALVSIFNKDSSIFWWSGVGLLIWWMN